MENPVRDVLLVDDHPVVRQGIARILAAEIPDLRLSESVDGASAFEQLRATPYHLIVLDLTLPGDSGLSLLRKIRRELPAELQEAARLEREPPPHSLLSDREYQVLRMIGAGRTVSEIGAELGLSVKTVSTYRARILEKMELRTSAELIHYAVVNKLVP